MMTRRYALAAFALIAFAGWSAAADTKMTFEIYKDAKGDFWWRLKDAEGTNLANSGQGYGKKADCSNMVDNFKSDISKYNFEVYEDNGKKFRFRMKAKNGNNVGGAVKGYDKKADVEAVIASIKKGASNADKKEVEK